MCCGIAAGAERTFPLQSRARLLRAQLAMHLGRIVTYTVLGALVGALGQLLWRQQALPIQRGLFVLAALLLLYQAVRLWRAKQNPDSPLERWLGAAAARVWSRLATLLANRGKHASVMHRVALGCLWGLVPCGLIYGALPIAMLAGDAWRGASVMLAFGMGTLPNLMLISRRSARLAQWGHKRWAARLAAIALALTALLILWRALTLSESMLRGGLCLTR